jgi:hypothetical protein
MEITLTCRLCRDRTTTIDIDAGTIPDGWVPFDQEAVSDDPTEAIIAEATAARMSGEYDRLICSGCADARRRVITSN